jgi:DNA-binding transcriptional LysR family regulator
LKKQIGVDRHPVADAASAVSFRQLTHFEAVGRLGNITQAARECGLSQPAATQALIVLQTRAGLALIEGKAKGTALTERGRELRRRLRALIFRSVEGVR